MSKNKKTSYTLQHTQALHCGFTQLYQCHIQHTQFNGNLTETLSREVLIQPAVAAVLPYDPDNRTVLLVEQFRIGVCPLVTGHKTPSNTTSLPAPLPWLLEPIAGYINQDESPENAACREAKEESGLTLSPQHLVEIARYWVSPGVSNAYVHLFAIPVVLSSEQAGMIHGCQEEGEEIRLHVVSFESAWQSLSTGHTCNSMTLIALQWLKGQQTSHPLTSPLATSK